LRLSDQRIHVSPSPVNRSFRYLSLDDDEDVLPWPVLIEAQLPQCMKMYHRLPRLCSCNLSVTPHSSAMFALASGSVNLRSSQQQFLLTCTTPPRCYQAPGPLAAGPLLPLARHWRHGMMRWGGVVDRCHGGYVYWACSPASEACATRRQDLDGRLGDLQVGGSACI
jgi:hypothetical protein